MTDSGTADQVRAALAAFEEGKHTLEELESVVAAALHGGRWTPALAMDVLRSAVAAGRVPPDTLRRLGLEEADDPTVARPVDRSSESVRYVPASEIPLELISTGQLLGGRYRLERKLGEGGMGVVYLASDQDVPGEIFAIKVLTPEIRERPDALELLREEVRKTRTLAHPNIVGVYSLNADRTGVFILMEYLEGKTLQALLDEDFGRGMRFDRAWPIIEDLGAALAYAHDHSVIHGDLKPANVFVTTSGRAKLLDFGIARAARGSRWGRDAAALGALTPAYASCEMLEYRPPDTRDDIYALACIIYEMLSGRHPFDRRNAVEARDAGEKPTPIAALTDRQNAALAQGLAFDRAARTAAVEMLLAGLAPGATAKPRAVFSRATGVAALIVAAAVALAYFVADRFWLSKHVTADHSTAAVTNVPSDKSIAVLPFTDMSEKKDQEYFADGMAEEILDILAKIPSLKVIGRTSSFQFKGRNEDLRAIGTELGVAYLLEGSVRRSADRVRVTAQLIDTRDGAHLWSETYDRPTTDALLMQGEIAMTLARSLEIGIGADNLQSNRRLINDAAYDLYLRGRYAAERVDADGLAAGVTYFRQALDADPNFADAEVALALTYYEQAFTSLAPSGIFQLSRQAAQSALKLNPNLGLAHAVLGGILTDYDWEWDAADREFKQAFALAPHDARVLTIAADLTVALGQLDAARQMLKQALAYDPLLADAYSTLTWIGWCSGRYEEMLAAARKILEIDPAYDWGHTTVGLALLNRGDPAAAITEINRETNLTEQAWGLALTYHALGRAADSNAALKRLIADGAGNYAYEVAEIYADRGERDEALKWLERAYVQKDSTLKWILRDPSMAKLESDPRYKAFLRKMKLPE
jgi:serine/threonine-protein kinase